MYLPDWTHFVGADVETASVVGTTTPQELHDKKEEIMRSVLGTDAAIQKCPSFPDSLRIEWQAFRATWEVFYHKPIYSAPAITTPWPLPSVNLGTASDDMAEAMRLQDQLRDLQLRISKFCSSSPVVPSSTDSGPLAWLKNKAENQSSAVSSVLGFAKWALIIGGGVAVVWAVWGIVHAKASAESSERLARETLKRFP